VIVAGAEAGCIRVPEDVPQLATVGADQMVMGHVSVRIVALGSSGDWDLEHLAHRHQLVQGVVDRCQADLGQPSERSAVDRLGGEVHVLSVEHLRHDPPLGREAELTVSKPVQEIPDERDLTCSGCLSAAMRRPAPAAD